MLHDIGVEWNDIPMSFKHGTSCIRKLDEAKNKSKWTFDSEFPMFSDDEEYINSIMRSIRTNEDI